MEVAPGDVELVLVANQALLDALEPLLRVPGCVLHHLEIPPDLVDPREHGAFACLLRPDLRRRVRPCGGRHERGEGKRAEEYETVTSHRNGVAKRTRGRRR
jgi:hypothetical protein